MEESEIFRNYEEKAAKKDTDAETEEGVVSQGQNDFLRSLGEDDVETLDV